MEFWDPEELFPPVAEELNCVLLVVEDTNTYSLVEQAPEDVFVGRRGGARDLNIARSASAALALFLRGWGGGANAPLDTTLKK